MDRLFHGLMGNKLKEPANPKLEIFEIYFTLHFYFTLALNKVLRNIIIRLEEIVMLNNICTSLIV